MSSSRPAERPARRPWPAGWSLRAQLLAALVGLLAVVCIAIGTATTVAVYQFQLGQLDNQLTSAGNRSSNALAPTEPDDGGGGHRPAMPQGQGPGTVSAHFQHLTGSFDFAQVVGADGGNTALSADQLAVLATFAPDRKPFTHTVPGLGEYRFLTFQAPDRDLVITGLPIADVDATMRQLIGLEITVGLAAIVLAAGLGAVIIRRTLRPLRRVAATARQVSELPLDRGEVALAVRVPDVDTDPRTEVGQVGAALNRMLGHVGNALTARQASEMRVRHFVADASHELRTPLAAIRGYAELTRRVRDGVPEAVAHAMLRVESETDRMTTLVEDMLLLARLDSGRPLADGPVDLSRLVIDAVSDAHVAAPGHHWRLDLPEESVTVTGDSARLHQVLANLLANARTHTPPGTTVTARLRTDGSSATVRVVDDGPGIPQELVPDVFERFARGDTSRSRAAGSTGLGLAIVAAVVEAHRGTVTVTSRPGYTEFAVRLPVPSAGGDSHALRLVEA
jgi:two-component system, OmpR family, sensor kinase